MRRVQAKWTEEKARVDQISVTEDMIFVPIRMMRLCPRSDRLPMTRPNHEMQRNERQLFPKFISEKNRVAGMMRSTIPGQPLKGLCRDQK